MSKDFFTEETEISIRNHKDALEIYLLTTDREGYENGKPTESYIRFLEDYVSEAIFMREDNLKYYKQIETYRTIIIPRMRINEKRLNEIEAHLDRLEGKT